MNKILIVLMFILLGSALIVVTNLKGTDTESFNIVYINNKNIALPDLTDAIDLGDGNYRINNANIIVDYNIYIGVFTINGTTLSSIERIIRVQNIFEPFTEYTVKLYEVGGSKSLTNEPRIQFRTTISSETLQSFTTVLNGYTYTTTQDTFIFDLLANASGQTPTYTNYQFKLQLEKGTQPTTYVVPKLLPIYQDNLSLQEKEKIGLGAFGGITAIISTINNIIEPIGDFINGLLSIF